ncbi:MAG: hypothetical protein K6B74_04320 [Ruminococcus sp.]|nr:hypothetical protein [Ruminococcus sp.]
MKEDIHGDLSIEEYFSTHEYDPKEAEKVLKKIIEVAKEKDPSIVERLSYLLKKVGGSND